MHINNIIFIIKILITFNYCNSNIYICNFFIQFSLIIKLYYKEVKTE